MDAAEIVARAAGARSLLVATDFDGTIAEIVTIPDAARAREDALAALAALARAEGVHVAVISGRTIESLRALTSSLPPVWRVAEHGAFVVPPQRGDEVPRAESAPHDVRALDELESLTNRAAARFPGMRVERKSAGVAVHVREVAPHDLLAATAELSGSFAGRVAELGLELMHGRQVFEARSPLCSKHAALERILSRLPAGTLPIYAGDDTTDEGAIALAKEKGGIGVYIASNERAFASIEPSVVLASPAEWARVLGEIAAQRRVAAAPRSGSH
ncbi:trehalose-phosphatase [Polyangium aurulentum]|uniref:trehalose-phosphatase n=1 Tax=Polyangium aurulentum TaxID=2567896 RepID=UPI0010ADAF7B|nr:trehalose-phosphatase [Polyangium aurulentum]UQA62731.1 trehalose-phosphatase [Polyangium aurulentum]